MISNTRHIKPHVLDMTANIIWVALKLNWIASKSICACIYFCVHKRARTVIAGRFSATYCMTHRTYIPFDCRCRLLVWQPAIAKIMIDIDYLGWCRRQEGRKKTRACSGAIDMVRVLNAISCFRTFDDALENAIQFLSRFMCALGKMRNQLGKRWPVHGACVLNK